MTCGVVYSFIYLHMILQLQSLSVISPASLTTQHDHELLHQLIQLLVLKKTDLVL